MKHSDVVTAIARFVVGRVDERVTAKSISSETGVSVRTVKRNMESAFMWQYQHKIVRVKIVGKGEYFVTKAFGGK